MLHSQRLVFSMPGVPFREPGFASVHSEDEGVHDGDAPDVHGVVHRVTRAQWRHILETEGAAGTHDDMGYGVYAVEVEAYDGRVLPALTLRTLPKSIVQLKGRSALPSHRYLQLIREGAADHGLDPEYQTWLAGLTHYEAAGWRQRVGAALVGGVVFALLLPVFLARWLMRSARGHKTAGVTISSAQSPLMIRYFRWVLRLAWGMQELLRPLLGCGCTNLPAGGATAGRSQ